MRQDRELTQHLGKKTTRSQDTMMDEEDDADDSEDTHDATQGDASQTTITEIVPVVQIDTESVQNHVAEVEDRRGIFTFTIPMETENETLEEQDDTLEGIAEAEDITIAQLFRWPAKVATDRPIETLQEVQYPDLPLNDRDEDAPETVLEPIDAKGDIETANSTEAMLDIEDGLDEVDMPETLPELLQAQETETVVDIETTLTPTSEPTRVEEQGSKGTETFNELVYPVLPPESLPDDSVEPTMPAQDEAQTEATDEDAGMLVATADTGVDQNEQESAEEVDDMELDSEGDGSADEDFTEASLQLNILQDYQDTLRGRQLTHAEEPEQDDEDIGAQQEGAMEEDTQHLHETTPVQPPVQTSGADITDGLTLSFTPARTSSAEPTPRKLASPAMDQAQSLTDDATMTIALDDDTALLKDFLNRAAASKAEKAAITTHRRESLQNRRDSDVIRHALASPHKVLEEKDPNSPSKHDNELTLDLSQPLSLNMGANALASPTPDQASEGTTEEKSLRGSRRSSREKKSRLPAPASASAVPAPTQASKISIRRADGTEHVVLKKSDAQELATLTRANTRKNKQGAFGVTVRLMKIALDAANLPPLDESTKEPVLGKNIRWDEQLAYYQENPETIADAESLATPDELGISDPVTTPSVKPKSKVSKNSTPKIRRVRGLGTANGTPGKGLLAPASLLPEEVQEEKEAMQAPAQQLPKPKVSKLKKMPIASSTSSSVSAPSDTKLPSLDILPVGVAPIKGRKSQLAAPKRVMLPQPVATLPVEGKENSQRKIGGATPRKGIPAPKVIVPPSVGMESGLPRRRGRKI